MQIGIILPQNEIGDDPGAIREFAQAAEDEGFAHAVAFDHVLGKDDYASMPFHEPFVLFGFLGACTRSIELVTGIIIMPQRQTALVAKQAAEVDMLSGGRLRLGLGVGWNPLEYQAMGEDFHTRGKRMDAQIPLLRRLWTERHVTAELGREQLADVGLNPPAIRDIPIWLGGKGPAAVRRAVTWGSGLILSSRVGGRPKKPNLPTRAIACTPPRTRPGVRATSSASRCGSRRRPEIPTPGAPPSRSGGRWARRI